MLGSLKVKHLEDLTTSTRNQVVAQAVEFEFLISHCINNVQRIRKASPDLRISFPSLHTTVLTVP